MNPRRGYLRVSEQLSDELERWQLPNYEQSEHGPRETAFNYDPQWQDFDEPLDEPAPAPLTAEDLESIRQSAYEEGFQEGITQGHAQGFEQGQQEGHAQGLEQGQSEGHAQGLAAAQGEIETHLAALSSVMEQMAMPLAAFDHDAEACVVSVAMSLAKELFRVELSTNPQILHQTVKEAIASLPMQKQQITIALSEADLALMQQTYDAKTLAQKQWQLSLDPSLNRGDVLVQAGDSTVDYNMDQRIADLMQRFIGANQLQGRPTPSVQTSPAASSIDQPMPAQDAPMSDVDSVNEQPDESL
ncbi:hypothetical protein VST7929_02012 [Vibrio stylophorae]|uniref:Flagellar assembly protein FliH n=1 Tax=Vibrio stylophorae TaxID=659351 RepID=A0ABM8ZUW0_9VIBR|nr:flagellar assembly protein FliH [Vibrio stylophorae]CAH0534111.1 hypothetical protein VST7929_02012 [Vibrio stylophorae]